MNRGSFVLELRGAQRIEQRIGRLVLFLPQRVGDDDQMATGLGKGAQLGVLARRQHHALGREIQRGTGRGRPRIDRKRAHRGAIVFDEAPEREVGVLTRLVF